MPSGSCFCGAVAYEFTGEPKAKALCHCTDCHKMSGSTYSTNVIVPEDGFKVTKGTPKEYSKTADSGNKITNYFCGDCGSTLWRAGKTFAGARVVKVGTLDSKDKWEYAKPGAELFTPERVSWVGKTDGTAELDGMPPH